MQSPPAAGCHAPGASRGRARPAPTWSPQRLFVPLPAATARFFPPLVPAVRSLPSAAPRPTGVPRPPHLRGCHGGSGTELASRRRTGASFPRTRCPIQLQQEVL